MNFDEARGLLAGYVLGNKELPKNIREAIECIIMIANSKNEAINSKGDNLLSNRKFTDSIIPTFQKLDSSDKLNYFRNLFYKEPTDSVEGMIANAINDILP